MTQSKNNPESKNDEVTSRSKKNSTNSDQKYDKKNSLAKIAEGELGGVIKKKSTLHQLTFKLTTAYRDAIFDLAQSRNEPVSETTRRALFAVLNNPALLDDVDETEQEYRQSLGPSRHHK